MVQMREFRTKLTQFLHDEAPAIVVQSGTIGDGGTVFGTRAVHVAQGPCSPLRWSSSHRNTTTALSG